MTPNEKLMIQALRAQLVAQVMTIDTLLMTPEPADDIGVQTMGQEVDEDEYDPEERFRPVD